MARLIGWSNGCIRVFTSMFRGEYVIPIGGMMARLAFLLANDTNDALCSSAHLTRAKQRIFFLLFVILLGFAHVTCSASVSPDQIARSVLPENSTLTHKAVELDLGKLGRAVIVIFRTSPQNTTYKGLIVLKKLRGAPQQAAKLPDMREADGLFDTEVKTVFSIASDNEDKELVILYTYYRLGSAEEPGHAGYVYRWSGNAWEIDDDKSRLLVGTSNASQARQKIHSASTSKK
jgi:hypothetical protein